MLVNLLVKHDFQCDILCIALFIFHRSGTVLQLHSCLRCIIAVEYV